MGYFNSVDPLSLMDDAMGVDATTKHCPMEHRALGAWLNSAPQLHSSRSINSIDIELKKS